MVTVERIIDWRGAQVLDSRGDKVGSLEEVYLDAELGEAVFACVKTGLFGRRLSFVPLQGARVGRDYVRVAHEKSQVKDAPSIEPDGTLTEDEETRLFTHYGVRLTGDRAGARLSRAARESVEEAGPAGEPQPTLVTGTSDAVEGRTRDA